MRILSSSHRAGEGAAVDFSEVHREGIQGEQGIGQGLTHVTLVIDCFDGRDEAEVDGR